jgi:hypothetical protein
MEGISWLGIYDVLDLPLKREKETKAMLPTKVRDFWDYLQIIGPFFIGLVALLVGFRDQILDLIRRQKFEIYPGDAVRFVKSADGSFAGFHLMCNLINKTTKVGTVHRLEVRVLGPQNTTCNFVWNLFYKYSPGGQGVEKEIDPYPVAVPQKDSKLIFVAFQAEANQNCKFPQGRYEFKVIGWVNSKDRRQPSNLESIFSIQITEENIHQLSQPNPPTGPVYITIPVIEWERQHR